jgi:hypothetical protein
MLHSALQKQGILQLVSTEAIWLYKLISGLFVQVLDTTVI